MKVIILILKIETQGEEEKSEMNKKEMRKDFGRRQRR
jgi:hypothetical protein